jgi:tRNA A37 threonylcarbamoyladenosine dehydratase
MRAAFGLSGGTPQEVFVSTVGEVGVCMTSSVRLGIQDHVKIDPDHHRVELENEKVRILRVRYGPHEKSVMQGHPSSVEINLTVAHLKVTYPDGRAESIEAKPGQVLSLPASQRMPENLSDFPYEAIAIEFK